MMEKAKNGRQGCGQCYLEATVDSGQCYLKATVDRDQDGPQSSHFVSPNKPLG